MDVQSTEQLTLSAKNITTHVRADPCPTQVHMSTSMSLVKNKNKKQLEKVVKCFQKFAKATESCKQLVEVVLQVLPPWWTNHQVSAVQYIFLCRWFMTS